MVDVSHYANHEYKDFINRGILRNMVLPHRTGLGAYAKAQPVDWFYFQAAAIDSQSRDRRTGFDTAFHDEALFLGMWEMGFTPKWATAKGALPGRYRLGWWYDPRSHKVFKDTLDGRLRDEFRGDDVGLYLGIDQMVWKEQDDPKDSQGLGAFGRWGWAHEDINKIDDYWEFGLSYTGLVPTRDQDVTAFAVAQGILSEQYREEVHEDASRETVFEFYYKYFATPWLIISPDFQVVVNPGGDKGAHDSIVGGVRIQVLF
ncbi:MAG: carbohydrate porin [Planctomycetes bacterium]|nr:carbohydrate porin [Planctomycetota bacterium]